MIQTNWDGGLVMDSYSHWTTVIWAKLGENGKLWCIHYKTHHMNTRITKQAPQRDGIFDAVYVLSASLMTIHSEWTICHTWLFYYSIRSCSLIQAVHQSGFWHLWLSFQDWDHILNWNGSDNFCLGDGRQVPSKFSHCSYSTNPKKKEKKV